MEKSKIWHDRNEEPTKTGVGIYLLDINEMIDYVYWNGWFRMRDYCCNGYKAWAYAADIVNL